MPGLGNTGHCVTVKLASTWTRIAGLVVQARRSDRTDLASAALAAHGNVLCVMCNFISCCLFVLVMLHPFVLVYMRYKWVAMDTRILQRDDGDLTFGLHEVAHSP